MKIILDTNIIHRDYSLDNGHILKLSDAAKRLGYEVYVPEIVVDEIFRQYEQELLSAYGKYTKGASLLDSLGLKKIKAATGEDYLSETLRGKRKLYEKRLNELGIGILPYPQTAHKAIVKKELEGRKPFASSKKGYRDSLIWETVKEQLIPAKDLLGETQVLFLSMNTQDFADQDKRLHPELIEEFASLGYMDNAVELVCDIDKFFKDTINTELEELEQIAKTLQSERKYNRVNLNKEIRSILYDEYVVKENLARIGDEEFVRIPQELESPTVQDVNLKDVVRVSVHKLTDGSAIVDCDITAVADIEFFMFKGDYPLFDDDKLPEILDWDWNDHYYLAATGVTLKARASLRVSEGFYRVLSGEAHVREVTV